MDIKTLLDNLHEEVSCSVCMCKFTDPKQLPCLHSFCLHCLNGIQRTSANPNAIVCPECRREFRVPGNGNLGALPTNFRINSLLDVLAIKECNTSGVKCGNCDKKSEHSFYCGCPPPPGQPPGYLTFLKIIVQIPPYPGQNTVQMPHTRVHSGDQMPPPRGHFTGTKMTEGWRKHLQLSNKIFINITKTEKHC